LWNGSYIERAGLSGSSFGTPFSIAIGQVALFIGVPPSSMVKNTLSLFSSLLIACTARGTWYWLSSTM
jgi:hypothetical protein